MRKRSMQIFGGLFVVAAMCVSAIASCACVHHTPAHAEPVSCHSAEHSSDQPIAASSFDASCICVEPAQTKAITIKSEQKRSHAEQPAVSPSSNSFAINVELTAVPQLSVPTFRDRQSIYKRLSTRSGPSRAPPIL